MFDAAKSRKILVILLILVSTIAFQSYGQNKDTHIDSALNLLIGKWFIPHNADINRTFNGDNTFIFNIYLCF